MWSAIAVDSGERQEGFFSLPESIVSTRKRAESPSPRFMRNYRFEVTSSRLHADAVLGALFNVLTLRWSNSVGSPRALM